MQELINWDAQTNRFRDGETWDSVQARLNDPPPLEYALLVQAINAYLARVGVSVVCGACWRGELEKETGGVGCCNKCAHSGENACIQKPLSCAVWLCRYTERLFPQADTFLRSIKDRLPSKIFAHAYEGGFRMTGLDRARAYWHDEEIRKQLLFLVRIVNAEVPDAKSTV